MSESYPGYRIRALFLFSALGTLFVLSLLYVYTRPALGVKAGYTTIGILLGWAAVEFAPKNVLLSNFISLRQLQKLFLVLIFTSLFVLHTIESLSIVVAIVVPIGYFILLIQYDQFETSSFSLIIQLMMLFSIVSYGKIATTYFYIGNMDLIKHTRFIGDLLSAGNTSAIPSNYAAFPGLHIVAGSVSKITGIPPHDSIMVLGTITFTSLLGAYYGFVNRWFNNNSIAYISIFLLSSSSLYVFFSGYFYPQAFVLALFFFLLFISAKASVGMRKPFIITGVLLGLSMTVSHHFTFLLTLPIVAVLFISGISERWRDNSLQQPVNWGIIGIAYCSAFYYLGIAGRRFFAALFGIAYDVISTFSTAGVSTGGNTRKLFLLGVEPIPIAQSAQEATYWFLSLEGLHNIALVSLISVATVHALTDKTSLSRLSPIAILASIGSIMILETPLAIKSLQRLALPLSFFVFVFLAWGVFRLAEQRSGKVPLPCLILILLVVSTGPALGFDDIQNYENQIDPQQSSISAEQFSQLSATSAFVEEHDVTRVSTLFVMKKLLSLFGTESTTSPSIHNSTINSSEPFIYYTEWHNYRERYEGDTTYLNYVRFSEEWIDGFIDRRDHIYDAGDIGIVNSSTRLAGG